MKIDFSRTLTNLDGSQIVVQADKAPRPLTLGDVAANSLLADDRDATGAQKVARFSLALKVYEAKEPLDLTPEDVSLIRERVGQTCVPLICGRSYQMLDG